MAGEKISIKPNDCVRYDVILHWFRGSARARALALALARASRPFSLKSNSAQLTQMPTTGQPAGQALLLCRAELCCWPAGRYYLGAETNAPNRKQNRKPTIRVAPIKITPPACDYLCAAAAAAYPLTNAQTDDTTTATTTVAVAVELQSAIHGRLIADGGGGGGQPLEWNRRQGRFAPLARSLV